MIYVGSCSWAEKSLVAGGRVYPPGIRSAEARLRYYASLFPTVEVDSSYYAVPSRKNSETWASRTPKGFIFHVKAHGAMTGHPVEPRGLPRDIRKSLGMDDSSHRVRIRDVGLVREIAGRFDAAIEPLQDAGKLGYVLFQFAPSLRAGPKTMDFLTRALGLTSYPKAVEFRHGSWYAQGIKEELVMLLRDIGAVLVCADEPDFGNETTVPFEFLPTACDAYFRLHGRNRETWFARGIDAARRFDYSYSDSELAEMLRIFLDAEKNLRRVFVMFNNHKDGQGIANARTLMGMLRNQGGLLAES